MKSLDFEFGRYAKKVCEKVLGYDIPENDKHTLTHEESIKFLSEFTSSKIVSNTDADDLKSINEFYKGKCVLISFDEFDCVTIGVCHGVTIKDGEYVFLFKNVLDVYDDDCDPHISVDDENTCYSRNKEYIENPNEYFYKDKNMKGFKQLLGERYKVSTINNLSKTIMDCIESSIESASEHLTEDNATIGVVTW